MPGQQQATRAVPRLPSAARTWGWAQPAGHGTSAVWFDSTGRGQSASQSSRSVASQRPQVERILNLTICLLLCRFIRPNPGSRRGYHNLSDAAFERTFERDKDDLRGMGVPVETGSNNPLFPDEVGYRIRRKDFELPAIEFTPAETAALGLAATVWESATQADQAVSALAKLRAAGVDPDPERLAGLAPSIGAREPRSRPSGRPRQRVPSAFRTRATIGTSTVGDDLPQRRVVPARRDQDKQEPRMFKVTRIDAPAERGGPPGSYSVPTSIWTRGSARTAAADAEAVVAPPRTGGSTARPARSTLAPAHMTCWP